jgi:hypothetical protein
MGGGLADILSKDSYIFALERETDDTFGIHFIYSRFLIL